MTKLYMKQLFAVEANTIVKADLEPAISIDHNQRLVDGITSVQAILGINEMTPMNAGAVVKQYKYVKKNSPSQVGEGETVELTEYQRKLVNTFELALNKYRKQTTAEAIQKIGADKAVNETDDLLLKEVQKDVKKNFFTALATGTGTITATVSTLQDALAQLWGTMSVYFTDMDVTPIYFVNPLDIADYLGKATISVQTAFGFQYVENFIGLGTVVIDPTVTKGTIRSTVKENLNGVYVPASGDVAAQFGLTYDATGMVGMKHFTADSNVCVDTLILSGVTFYAEDASGIFTATLATA